MTKQQYQFQEIIKDQDGDFVGLINFEYNNDTYAHEFTFVTKEQTLVSIDFGWKIPYIKEVWNEIEDTLKAHSEIH